MSARNLRTGQLLAGFGISMLSLSAGADGARGWYVGGSLGAAIPSSQYLNSQGDVLQNSWNMGFYGSIAGGFRFSNGLRPELEFAYRNNSISSLTEIGPVETTNATSDVSGYETGITMMANLWYDYRTPDGFFSVLHPYGGAGIGIANVNLQGEAFNNPGNAGFVQNGPLASGGGSGLAYQIGFGASLDLLSNLEATADFRYLFTSNISFDNQAFGGKWTGEYRVPSFGIGLRYRFGASEE